MSGSKRKAENKRTFVRTLKITETNKSKAYKG